MQRTLAHARFLLSYFELLRLLDVARRLRLGVNLLDQRLFLLDSLDFFLPLNEEMLSPTLNCGDNGETKLRKAVEKSE